MAKDNKKLVEAITSMDVDFAQWYTDVVKKAELLGLSVKREEPTPKERTAEYYKKRPCKELVGDAAEILEKYIAEHPVG